jgi:hypothetical protein
MSKIKVGDLVKLIDGYDEDRRIGIIVEISPKQAHVKNHGRTEVLKVYWPQLNESDWEYYFFLEKIEPLGLTERKK